MNAKIFFVFFLLLSGSVFAQEPKIFSHVMLQVINQDNAPIESATAQLRRSKDSVLVRTSLTDKAGMAEFERVEAGSYFISVSMLNYEDHVSAIFEVNESHTSLPKLILQARSSNQLKDVTVTAKKPFIQKMPDKIVVNVDNSIISAGSTAMDVLERSPGVNVDQNDLISLRGRAGVVIFIDGKRTALTGADLANYLRALPSETIDHIDIITNPSAKYDAAGNSGIIDIYMKKDQRLGANGTLTAGYGQGVYPKANAGGTFNYRNKKLNSFANYSYAYRMNLNHLILDRNFYTDGVFTGQDKKDNYSKMPVNSHTARVGMDYNAGKRTVIGFVLNSNFTHFQRQNTNSSLVIDKNKLPSFTFNTDATNNDHFNNTVLNVNFRHRFDSSGKNLTADLDYGVYDNNSLSLTTTRYYQMDGSTQQPDYILKGDQNGRLTFKTGKLDYEHQLTKAWKMEAGVKASYVTSDNDAKFFDVSTGTPINDTGKTNQFLYKEGNYAGYLNFHTQFKKFDVQVGLRGEQTTVNTRQVKGDITWDSSYFQLFPSAFINYKLNDNHTLGVSVSRRIDRPGYSDLNPFLFLIDVSTYATGRPGLLPQLTWSYELNYTWKNLNFTLGYSHTKDVQNIAIIRFSDVFPHIPLPDSNITVQVPVNLASSDYFGLSVSVPVRVSKWWNILTNANVYYNHFNANLAGTPLNNGAPAVDLRVNNTFTFAKSWSAELNGSLNTGGRNGYMVSDPRWGISVGAQKNVWSNKATIRFNYTDIFWTNLPKATITYNNYIEYWHAYRESRVATLSFTYRFGNNKVAAAQRRSTASEEERRRAGG
jgi:iron complex outermembrane receptor protein